MNTPLRILLGLVLLSATACVRSLAPFCPVVAQAPRPDLNGTWHGTDGEGDIKKGTRWTFADGQVSTTNSAEGVGGTLDVIYFQAGGAWFADSVAAEVEGGLDDWWKMHTVPAHHIAQIVVDGDRLRVTPLSQQWLAAAIRSTNALTANLRITQEQMGLFAARPAAWQDFLGKVASDTNAFPPDRTMVLKRAP